MCVCVCVVGFVCVWFLLLLFWLGLALAVCSFRRQLPILKSALTWIDYKSPRQIAKLSIAQTIQTNNSSKSLEKIRIKLKNQGWNIKETDGRIAARQGVIGRLGPILIHLGMILLMIGATYGSLNGQTIEKFLAPGRSIDLLDKNEEKRLTIELQKFQIERDALLVDKYPFIWRLPIPPAPTINTFFIFYFLKT